MAGSPVFPAGRRPRKGMLCLFGFLAAVVLYGAVMNTASVLLWSHSLQWELIAAACAAGLPMDLLHGGSTALLLYLLADPVQGKLDRMQGEVWMGPRVNGEWAMETKTDHRPDMRSVVCLFGRGAIPGRSPQRGSSDRRSQGK